MVSELKTRSWVRGDIKYKIISNDCLLRYETRFQNVSEALGFSLCWVLDRSCHLLPLIRSTCPLTSSWGPAVGGAHCCLQGAVWRSSLWALLSPWRACAGAPDITLFYEENNNQVSSIFAARNWGSRRLGTIRTGQITAATEPVNTVAEQDKTVKVVGVSSWKWDECLPAFFLLPFSLPLSLSPSPP